MFSSLFLPLKSTHSSKTYANTAASENLSFSTLPQISNVFSSSCSPLLPSFFIFRTLHYSGLWRFHFLSMIARSKFIFHIAVRLIFLNMKLIIAFPSLKAFNDSLSHRTKFKLLNITCNNLDTIYHSKLKSAFSQFSSFGLQQHWTS